MSAKVRSVLLIGPTGAGKTPLGCLMEESGVNGTRCFHFDFGQELRNIGGLEAPPPGFSREDHLFVRQVLEEGILLEKRDFHLAKKAICGFMRRRGVGGEDILVLNGLPRHREQAEDMAGLVNICALAILECEASVVYRRISTNAGKDREGRTDDDLLMVQKKLDIFHRRTMPLIEYYCDLGVPVFRAGVTAESGAPEALSGLLVGGLAQDMESTGLSQKRRAPESPSSCKKKSVITD